MIAGFLALIAAFGIHVPLGLDAYVPAPAENPITRESVALGRKLFFDKRLSRDNSVSCASCHDPRVAFSDRFDRARGVGHKIGPRRTPRILNRAWGRTFFWDGRAASLEDQVMQPVTNPMEMSMSIADVVLKLKAAREYKAIDELTMRRALASYVRTILSGDSPYDRFTAGDRTAMTAGQQRGLALFRGKAACISCHLGPNLTDEEFHSTGAGGGEDSGRAFVTGKPEDFGLFKTPGLRHVAQTPPYFHDGSAPALADVIEHYDRGGRPVKNLDAEMRPLHLSAEEKRDLAAFLEALTGAIREGLDP